MLESEMGIAYEVTDSFSYRHGGNDYEEVCYIISIAHSQGFDWNQDLFATRYEQMCQVVYDGHVDTMEAMKEQLGNHELDEEEDDDTFGLSKGYMRYNSRRNFSDTLVRPRRKSDRSISFSADREQGTFRRTEVTIIDVDSDTQENKDLKCILN